MATLWPSFLRDIFIIGAVGLLLLSVSVVKWRTKIPLFVVGSGAAIALLTILFPAWRGYSLAWQDGYVGETGFDVRNFNVALADTPALIGGRRLIRIKEPVSGPVSLPHDDSLMFILVDGTAEIGGVRLSHCRRLGSLSTNEGPYLMDAQACRVDGNAEVLLGSQNSAAAIRISRDGATTLIVLDEAFLGQNAPKVNQEWLLNILEIRK